MLHACLQNAGRSFASHGGVKILGRKVHHIAYVNCMQNHVRPRHESLPVEAEARGRALRCWSVYERVCKLSSICKDIMLLGFCCECGPYPSLCDTFLHGVWSYLRMLVQASAPPLLVLSSAFSWLLLPPSIKAWAVHAS